MEKTRSEDTLIFNALTPDITDMQEVYEAIEDFCNEKKSNDSSDRFNIILFQEDGPNYLEDFTLYPDNILIAMKSLEPILVRANVAGGIMTAITFIIDVFKKISEKCFRLIVLTDSGSLRIPDHFIPVLENLIDQVRDMPFFIDIVRLGIDDPREDLKLMRLARRCGGDIHEINDIRALGAIMQVLAVKREIPFVSGFGEKNFQIPEENQPFYINLADDPTPVSTEETCGVCFQKDTKGLVKCPKCETIVHKKCWSQWTRSSHIGIPFVYRCHSCYNLLRLDPEYVFNILSGKKPIEEEIKVQKVDVQTWLESLESGEGPKIIQVQDSLPVSAEESDHLSGDLSVEIQWENEDLFDEEFDKVFEEEFKALSDDELRIVWCTECNKITTNEFKRCPHCNADISNL